MGDGMNASWSDMSVPGLLRLARSNAATTRRAYAALGEALVDGGTSDVTLTDWQRSILTQLVRQVIGDIYSSLRWLVLAGLEDGDDTGHGAWSNLAPDSEERLYSIMFQRGLLKDISLIEAITHRLYQHQLEHAIRPPDRNRWTNEPSLDSPSDFFDQPLSEFSPVNRRLADYVVDRSRRTDRYGNPVLASGEIDAQLYERLHWRVAAVLRHMIVGKTGDYSRDLDVRIELAAKETIRHSQAISAAPTCSAEVARTLEEADLLTVETVHRLLKTGEISLFEEAFSRLAGIRPVLLRRLIYESGGECFAILARALDMEFDRASSIFALTRSVGTDNPRGGIDWNEPLKAIYDGVSIEDANSVRAHWTRRSEFASALWETEPRRYEESGKTLH
jgi:hypothetical protein